MGKLTIGGQALERGYVAATSKAMGPIVLSLYFRNMRFSEEYRNALVWYIVKS